MKKSIKRTTVLPLALLGLAATWRAPDAEAQKLERAIAEQAGADKAAASSQAKIDQLSEHAQDMAGKYRQALVETASLKNYNEQLGIQVKSQNEQLTKIRQELTDIEATQRDVLPLLKRMVDTLEQFVLLDVPFLLEERTKRIATLKNLMERADISTSEKYRRILEAYQIEMEYGRTMTAYRQKLADGRDAEMVRLGRVVLLYRVMEGGETGYWDNTQKRWVPDPESRAAIENALSIAKEEKAPDLIIVPVPAPQGARS